MTLRGLQQLRSRYPYPATPPPVEPLLQGWLAPECAERLRLSLGPEAGVVVELGAWLGVSTLHLARCAPAATVVTIDHWRGSAEHQVPDYRTLLPTLYERFLVNTFPLRDRIIPVRRHTLEGLVELHSLAIAPDLIYVDASHEYESVRADLNYCLALFPSARIVGDDWTWQGVRRAVIDVMKEHTGRHLHHDGTCWWLESRRMSL